MDSFYRDIILDHFKHPRNFGSLGVCDARSEGANPFCGDKIIFEVKLKAKSSKLKAIETVMFQGEGCAISMASASMLTEKVKGMKRDDVLAMKTEDVLELLGGITLMPTRIKCAVLPLEVLQKTVALVKNS